MHRQQFTFQNKLLFKFKPNKGLFFLVVFTFLKSSAVFLRTVHFTSRLLLLGTKAKHVKEISYYGEGGGRLKRGMCI